MSISLYPVLSLFGLLFFFMANPASADQGGHVSLNPDLEKRAQYLEHDLRCVTCAGQSLSDSTAPLAMDLKGFVRRELIKGRSEEAIKADLVEKYGPTILARPPLSGVHLLLWLSPFVFLISAGIFVSFWLRRTAQEPVEFDSNDIDENEKLRFEQIRRKARDENV